MLHSARRWPTGLASILRLCFGIYYLEGMALQSLQFRFRLDHLSFG